MFVCLILHHIKIHNKTYAHSLIPSQREAWKTHLLFSFLPPTYCFGLGLYSGLVFVAMIKHYDQKQLKGGNYFSLHFQVLVHCGGMSGQNWSRSHKEYSWRACSRAPSHVYVPPSPFLWSPSLSGRRWQCPQWAVFSHTNHQWRQCPTDTPPAQSGLASSLAGVPSFPGDIWKLTAESGWDRLRLHKTSLILCSDKLQ